jgi:hypothetical protein
MTAPASAHAQRQAAWNRLWARLLAPEPLAPPAEHDRPPPDERKTAPLLDGAVEEH